MSSIYSWSTTAGNNASSDSDITWAEGQAPSSVNNSARQMMARIAEYIADTGGALTAGGTANGITVTANSAFTAYSDGMVIAFKAAANNTGLTQLSVNGVGNRQIRKMGSSGDEALAGGEIFADGVYLVFFNSDLNSGSGGWQLVNPLGFDSGVSYTWTAKQTFSDVIEIGPNNIGSDTDILIRGAANIASESQLNLYVDSTGSGTSSFFFRKNGGNQTDGQAIAQIDNAGRFYTNDGNFTNPSHSFLDDTDTGFYRDGNGHPAITHNGSRTVSFGSSGIDFNTDIDSDLDLTNSSIIRIRDSGGTARNIASIDAGDIVNLGAGLLPLMLSSSTTPTYNGNDILTTASTITNSQIDSLNANKLTGTVNNGQLSGTYGGFSIDASGQTIRIGHISAGGSDMPTTGRLRAGSSNNSNPGLVIRSNSNTDVPISAAGFQTQDGTTRGGITVDSDGVSYNTTSDERLKTFTGEYSPEEAASIILADPVRRFTWDSTGNADIGWGAQTSHAVDPSLACEGRGEPGDEDFCPWSIDKGSRTPYLWSAMKGVLERLDDLEAENVSLRQRVRDLEGAA